MATDPIREILDRTRRIETRLTKYISDQGGELSTQQPVWRDGTVHVPSPRCGLQEILAAVPANWEGDVSIYCNSRYLVTLGRELL